VSAIKKIWHDPVWSKVIAGVLLAAGGMIVAYLAGWWPSIGNFFGTVATFAVRRSSVPIWILALLVIAAAMLVVVTGFIVWRILYAAALDWRSYVSDEIFGIRWRWKYDSGGNIYDLQSFCPACDYQTFASWVDPFIPRFIKYVCDDCGRELGQFDGTETEYQDLVVRKIHQKIRTDKWRNR